MLYRITVAVDVEAPSLEDAAKAAQKAVTNSRQASSLAEHTQLTRCEVTTAVRL